MISLRQLDSLLDRRERDLLEHGLAAVVGPEEAAKRLGEMSHEDTKAAFKRVFYGDAGLRDEEV